LSSSAIPFDSFRRKDDDDQYQKRVALKLVKHGMDSQVILRRFRQERQILASFDHNNIAKLLDGGTTEDSLPVDKYLPLVTD
jgi:serine/threonine protein kinase